MSGGWPSIVGEPLPLGEKRYDIFQTLHRLLAPAAKRDSGDNNLWENNPKMVFQQLIPDDAGFDSSTPSWPGLTGPSTPLVEQNHSLAF
jgi:hypothetical protein